MEQKLKKCSKTVNTGRGSTVTHSTQALEGLKRTGTHGTQAEEVQ